MVFVAAFFLCALYPAVSSAGGNARTHQKVFKEHKEERDRGDIFKYDPVDGLTIIPLDTIIDPSTTFVFQGSPNPDIQHKKNNGVSWVLYLDIYKKFWDWGIAFVEMKLGIGDTIERSLNVFNGANYNSYPIGGNFREHEFWYKQFLFDKQVTITLGEVSGRDMLAQNKYAGDDDIQFLAYIFNRPPTVEWAPAYTFTIHTDICINKFDFMDFQFVFMEGDADWEKIFDKGIYGWQVNLKPDKLFNLDPEQWAGNYRFYSWVNTRFHTKLVDEGDMPTTDTKEINYGFGVSFDQKITDVYGVFARTGFQRPDLIPAGDPHGTTIEFAWAAGGQMTGKYWGRKGDIFGLGVGQVVPSREYAEAGNSGRAEGHIETYYSMALTRFLFVSPEAQLIWNPGGIGTGAADPVFVYGLRVHADF